MSHAEAIQENRAILQRCTTINSYVIDYLSAEDVIDEAQEHDLLTERNLLKQRILLFQWLKEGSSQKYKSFLKVMKDTEQEHVANHMTGSTEEDHLPLSDARYERLRKIRHKMAHVTRIDDEVIAELRKWKTISKTDVDEIRAENVDYTKVSKLINAVMRRSNHSYKSFQVVLRDTLQASVANFLSEGEMLEVHLNNNRPDLDGILSSAVNEAIRNKSEGDKDIKELISEMNGFGVNLVKAIPGQSIVIFIYCRTVQNAVKFTQLFNSGRLQYILDCILNRLLLTIEPSNKETLDSRIILEDDDINSLEEFTGMEVAASFIEKGVVELKRQRMLVTKQRDQAADANFSPHLVDLPRKTTIDRAPGTEFHEMPSDVIECSICAEIFTNPKLLPCIHTFCLHCLEKYGENKNPGDHMACPLCRNEFVIPDEGFSNLPNNFFIGKIVEIWKLAPVPGKQEVCELCSEDTAVAKKFCIDCGQKLCDRCSTLHSRIKHCQSHQVVELGSQLNFQEVNFHNSYCEHHPKELIKMFCHEDNVAICLICCVESHQSHRRSNVDKAAGQFAEQLKDDLRKVANRRPECEEAFEKLEKFKTEFTEEVLKTEESIRNSGITLKELIDQHTEVLVQNLRVVRDRNLKYFETTKHDVDRFRVMIDSYQGYCNELLTRGSPADICRAASQMHTTASDLEKQPVNCGVDDFYCDQISFLSANLETLMKQHKPNNVVGELNVTKSADRIVRFQKRILVERFVPMGLGVVDLITKYMKDELQKIKADLKECSGSIDTSKDEPGFIIRGTETGAEKAAEDLLKLADNIIMYDHDIDRPGIPAYFYSKHGKEVLCGIQINHKVSIELNNTQSRTKPQAVAGDGLEICRVEMRPGKFMILMRGDITKCSVDAIVIAANEKLEHIGGVAAAIAEAAGPKLEEDCLARIKLVGPLLPGQACVTRAGKLPCKKVIHTVGPRWSGGKADEENILAMAVESSLNAADEEGLKSIAMPSISTGIFGFPLDRATDIIVDAVKSYLVDNSSTTVRDVVFIDSDSQVVVNIDMKLRTIQIDGPYERPAAEKGRRVVEGPQDNRLPQDYCNRPSQNQDPPYNTSQRSIYSGPREYPVTNKGRRVVEGPYDYCNRPSQIQDPPYNTSQRSIYSGPREYPVTNEGRRVVEGPHDYCNRPSQNQGPTPNISQRENCSLWMERPRTIADPRQQSEEERYPQQLSRIIFSIYALSRKAIDEVLKDIEEVIREYIIDKVLDSPQDQENIGKLKPQQIKRIKGMPSIYPVQIEVETGRLKRIRIRGPPMAVTSVIDQVHNIFQEAHRK